jgi:hypothetical protein
MEQQLHFKEAQWRGKIYDGAWIKSSGGQADDIEPATGWILTSVGVADAKDVHEAASKASIAQRTWQEAPFLAERPFQVWFRSGNGLSTSSFGVLQIIEDK